VTFDLDLDLEHTLDAGLPGVHRVQVWWRSGHLSAGRSDLRKSVQTDRRRTPHHCISSFLEWANNNKYWITVVRWEEISVFAELRVKGLTETREEICRIALCGIIIICIYPNKKQYQTRKVLIERKPQTSARSLQRQCDVDRPPPHACSSPAYHPPGGRPASQWLAGY